MGKYHDRINWKKELRLLPGYIIVCAWVALTAAILFWIVCASLSSTKEILTGRVVDFSNGLKWDNYVTAWNTQNVSLYFFNSLVYAIVSCVGVLLISAPGAYVLSRWKFVGGKAIRIGLVIAMSVPTIMIIMPLYSLAVQWGIKGRVLLVVLYIMLRVPYTAIYLLDFFSSLSRSYEEAAYIDGCSKGRTLIQVILPLVKPGILAVGLYSFLISWEDFLWGLTLVNKTGMRTLASGIAMTYLGEYNYDWGRVMAAAVGAAIPILIIFIFLQKYMIAGLTAGAVKE